MGERRTADPCNKAAIVRLDVPNLRLSQKPSVNMIVRHREVEEIVVGMTRTYDRPRVHLPEVRIFPNDRHHIELPDDRRLAQIG